MKHNWTYKKLGELVNIRTGKLDANAANENGMYPFFTCSREPLRINSYSYDCECVLVAGNGELNVKYYNGKFDAYQRTYIIEKKQEVDYISTYYIYLFFQKYIDVLRRGSIGGIIKYIKLGDLTNALIPIPSLDEQQAIVRELDDINRLIDLQEEQLREYDRLAQSLFYTTFGDPATNPKGWEVKKLKEVVHPLCPISYGIVQPGDGDKEEVPVVRPIDLRDSMYVGRGGLKYTTKSISDSYRRTILRGEELLICVRGTTGILGIAKQELKDCNVTRGIVPLFFADEITNKLYMYMLLKTRELQDIIAENTFGATLRQINIKALRELPIMCPSLALQQTFAAQIEAIEQQKTLVRRSLDETRTLLAARMQYYFNS